MKVCFKGLTYVGLPAAVIVVKDGIQILRNTKIGYGLYIETFTEAVLSH